jgi:hypothetical protein
MKTLVVLMSLIISTNLSAQKGRFYMNTWHQPSDNKTNIPAEKYSYFDKGKLFYFISNDNENVYVDIKVEESSVQNRILKEGLTIWINMDRKLTKKMGVRFPVGSEYDTDYNKRGIHENKINQDESLVTPLIMANTIELVGFKGEDSRRFPSDNADTFRGSVRYDREGTLYYHMTMPIDKLPLRNSKDGTGAMPFILGIEYGAPPLSLDKHLSMTPPPAYRSASSRSRGGSRSGASGKGGRSGGISYKDGPMTKANLNPAILPPVLIWVKNIKLAKGR